MNLLSFVFAKLRLAYEILFDALRFPGKIILIADGGNILAKVYYATHQMTYLLYKISCINTFFKIWVQLDCF